MADGIFASKVSATRDANLATNPIFVQLTDGTAVLGVTSGSLDVNLTGSTGSITVTATDLDIRDLTHVSDSVQIGDGTTLADVLDGTVDALYVAITDGTETLAIDASGYVTANINGTVTVTATDLDIRDLTDASDSVSIGDGTDTLAVNTDGSINVNVVSGVQSDEFHDYNTATPAADSTSNLDYTVSNTTGLLTSVICSSSGDAKFELQSGPLASLATDAVIFLTGKEGDTKQVFFDPAIEATGTTPTFRVIATNRENQANDVYVTFVGRDI